MLLAPGVLDWGFASTVWIGARISDEDQDAIGAFGGCFFRVLALRSVIEGGFRPFQNMQDKRRSYYETIQRN